MLLHQPSPRIGFQPPAGSSFRKLGNLIHAYASSLASLGGKHTALSLWLSGVRFCAWVETPKREVCQSRPSVG